MFLRKIIPNNLLFKTSQLFNTNIRQLAVTATHHSAAGNTTASSIDFNNTNFQNYLESLRQEFYALRTNAAANDEARARVNELSNVVNSLEQHRALKGNMTTKEELANEKDDDMRQLIEEENAVYTNLLAKTEEKLMQQLLELSDAEFYPAVMFEVNSGAGGQEAMLFAKELFDMYINYFDYNEWPYEVLEVDKTDIGGLRHAVVTVEHEDAFTLLRYEGGVHRVQRIPTTEKAGRVHTSTASIAVIPRPANVQVTIADKDLKIETKRASGAGGQHVNTTDSAVRVVHLPTGIAVECQTERSQIRNRETALKRLQAKLLQQKLANTEATTQSARKAQQGSLNRNEKIRTYNFAQDRITDHRVQNGTVHNLEEYLKGTEHLGSLINHVILEQRKLKLAELIATWNEENITPKKAKGGEK